ncbi:MAG TPA: NAD(P)/FAD-dependent oxidoreductase [Spirochaetia bacterium]|nr:NAD(P)/FAD-dependent oxidoreductase [Spirochaetia bacterium]
MNKLHVDVLVVGGGPAGTPLAMTLAKAGKQVLLVEDGPGLGGTCLFHGCIPSKIFRESARVRSLVTRAVEFGITGTGGVPAVDWAAIQTRRHAILNRRATGALSSARQLPSLRVVFGRARFTGSHEVRIDGARETQDGDGIPASDTIQVSFDRAVIATGSVANRLKVEGAESPGVLSSEGLIGIGYVPASMVVIGAGPIGVEMAQIFHMLGTRISILEALPDILQPVDSRLSHRLEELLVNGGIPVETGVGIDRIETTPDGHRVHYHKDGTERSADARVVLSVVGRRPNVDNLGLESTKVRFDAHGIKVNQNLTTDEPHIYALGDVVGQPMFAHWATAQAQALASHLLGKGMQFPKSEHNSAVIFSYPEVGMVGLTEEAARAAGLDVAVAEYNYAVDARAQIAAEAEGMLRIVYRTDDQTVVGVHAMVEGAADLMGEAALAVRSGVRLSDLVAAIHPHPTLTESFGLAARAAMAERPSQR